MNQNALFEQYSRVVRTIARRRPLLLTLDDLQWADVGSVGLLFHLGKSLAGGRVLVVGAYRPTDIALGRGGERHPLEPVVNEFKLQWGDIEIDLREAEGERFVAAYLDTEPNRLSEAFRTTLFRQTAGLPQLPLNWCARCRSTAGWFETRQATGSRGQSWIGPHYRYASKR